MRPSGREASELRDMRFITDYTMHAEGSVLAEFGNTRVLCTASIEERVPGWMRNTGRGWITAEYSMLPGSTSPRSRRESSAGRVCGRTMEIQRLIGRSLRAVTDLGVDIVGKVHRRRAAGQVQHLALDLAADRVAQLDLVPRGRHALLEAERDALLVVVDVENLDLEFLFNAVVDPESKLIETLSGEEVSK